MKLRRALIENYRAITRLELDLDPKLHVFVGDNGKGKTSVLNAIAVGLGSIPHLLPGVSSVGFLRTDRRGRRPLQVVLEAGDGTQWTRSLGLPPARGRLAALRKQIETLVGAEEAGGRPRDLPILAFYTTDRAVADHPQRRGQPRKFPRFEALEGALSPRTDFRALFTWFYGKEHEEASEQKRRRDFAYRSPELEAVRRAIASMVPGVSEPMVAHRPLRFVVSVATGDDEPEELALDQLGGGSRIMLALAADLARRMAQGNPHLDDPLQSDAVVLIDEVELHLYPSWQQRVLPDLTRTFPNAQFLVSTQSPQVLTTVEAERITQLEREDHGIVALPVGVSTSGARASDALQQVMGVDERPSSHRFVKELRRYLDLVASGKGESGTALALRNRLVAHAPDDPDLSRAAMEICRQQVLGEVGREK